MSVAVDNGSQRISPRNMLRPPPVDMPRVQMQLSANKDPVSSNQPMTSPNLYRQSTLNGSYDEMESRRDLSQRSVQYHYEVPNLSSMLYEYTNREKDRVQQSFRVGNYHSLRDLPRHLLPGNVSQWSRSKIESNLYSQVEERSYVEL